MRALAWAVVAAAVFVVALGVLAILVLVRTTSTDIPTVSDISARVVDDTVEFTWADPGLGSSDTYQVATNDGSPVVQQREASFVVDAEPGDRVCVSVAVNREGRTGAVSAEKCADVPE
jgi:hypothetical protein